MEPILAVENSHIVLDKGKWPNFHDAEVHNLAIWRGDVRPEDQVWIGPVIDLTVELCALEKPYIVKLRFHDCNFIKMQDFDHQNAIYDLHLELEDRGNLNNGSPMTPYIVVVFQKAFGTTLSFKCLRMKAIERIELS